MNLAGAGTSPGPTLDGPEVRRGGMTMTSLPTEVGALQVQRVLASVAELQCACRPGTVRELVRLTSMEPAQVVLALQELEAQGTVVRADAGGSVQYRLAPERWPFMTPLSR